MSEQQQTPDVAPWVKGEKITAERLNESVIAINNAKRRPAPPSQVNSDAPGYGIVHQFKIVSIQGNYLTCNPYDGVNAAPAGIVVYIAKPTQLRSSIASRAETEGTVTYTSYSSDGQQRTATRGATTETQIVTPRYLAGDIIYAVRGVVGKLPLNGDSEMIEHLDINADGRAWAKG